MGESKPYTNELCVNDGSQAALRNGCVITWLVITHLMFLTKGTTGILGTEFILQDKSWGAEFILQDYLKYSRMFTYLEPTYQSWCHQSLGESKSMPNTHIFKCSLRKKAGSYPD